MIIKNKEALRRAIKKLREEDKTISVCNGSFDILHVGHLDLFTQASLKADVLIVLVNSDNSIKRNKGPKRPIVNELQRARMIDALKPVSLVYIFEEDTPLKTLEIIRPNIYVSGLDYGYECIEKNTVEKYGGKVSPKIGKKTITTTAIIRKILDSHATK